MTRALRSPAVRPTQVSVDGSAKRPRAAELAAKVAHALGAPLTLLRVTRIDDLPMRIGEAAATRQTEDGPIILTEEGPAARHHRVGPSVELRRVRASGQILRAATTIHPDRIVTGTRGLTAAKSLLRRSVFRSVCRDAKAPVDLVR